MRDYSQPGDPYGIAAEYTSQSAHTQDSGKPKNSGIVDVRGNTRLSSRTLPTQAEADAIMLQE